MKPLATSIMFLFITCALSGRERKYAASTPADVLVKQFLGIPLSDSVDYIRWDIALRDEDYALQYDYNIIPKNSNVPGQSKHVDIKGRLTREQHYYILHHQEKTLRLVELNVDLLHILQSDNSLLIGNGGWSYTLNSVRPARTADITTRTKPTVITDSMIFVGRTPCGVPGVITSPSPCYKLKWKIVFYGNSLKNEPTTCKVYATPYRKEGVKQGRWKMVKGNNGRILYHLYDVAGKPYLYLEKADENILLFTDASGKLLTGDEEYSYTLNRQL